MIGAESALPGTLWLIRHTCCLRVNSRRFASGIFNDNPEAENDLRAADRYIRRPRAPRAACDWLAGARKKIDTLSEYPERAHPASGNPSQQEPIRELLYGGGNRGVYRILFAILDNAVFVLHGRHGSMLPVEPEK